MIITIFQTIKDTSAPFHKDVISVLARVKNGSSKDLVKRIRSEASKSDRNELKKLLPAICFSGTFNKRNDSAIIEHSGLICLDFDGYNSKKALMEGKETLSKDKFVFSVFVSPSDNGLKVLVKIPADVDNHQNYFNSLEKYFNSPYFDSTSKNISRVCYESHDPKIYINEKSSLWDKIEEPEHREVQRNIDAKTITITDENKIVEILIKWWEKKFPMVDGQRNHNAYILAAAFNDFGINRSLASYMLNQHASDDFPPHEIQLTIDSAYAKKHNFGSKSYEDEECMNSVRAKVKRGVPKKDIRSHLQDLNLDSDVIESVLTRVEEENSKQTFWTKTEKGMVKINHIELKQFLEDSGFYKFCPEGGTNYVFVKVTNNLIDHTSEKEIKDFVLGYVIKLDDISVYNYFAEMTRYFKDDFLSMLATIDIHFVSDTKETAYLYYLNCAVKITSDDIVPIDYLDLGGYVWKDHVINRAFTICDVKQNCYYKRFIENICAKDESRIESMKSTIGFLMHAYKSLSASPAVILNDEVISDNPEGGTGKGLFMNALAQMKKVVTIDGKSFNFEKSFAYQLVSSDTQILVFDDVKKQFDFERLFSLITEGLTLEKKNKDAIKIPFSKSPKIAITTNYAIKGAGNSFARRKWELELHQHYNKSLSPLDDFGKLMFGDWDEEDWCEFDNYMVGCLKSYLGTGLIKSVFVNLKIRQLSAETSHDFIEWCGLINNGDRAIEHNKRLRLNDLYEAFVGDYPDHGRYSKRPTSRQLFGKWVDSYSRYTFNCDPKVDRDMLGKWVMIQPKEAQDDDRFDF